MCRNIFGTDSPPLPSKIHLRRVRLPKASFIKIQPLDDAFVEDVKGDDAPLVTCILVIWYSDRHAEISSAFCIAGSPHRSSPETSLV